MEEIKRNRERERYEGAARLVMKGYVPREGVQEDERENIGLDVANPSSSTKIYDNVGCCFAAARK